MTVQLVVSGSVQKAVDVIAPAAQASTNALAVVTGSTVDARLWGAVSYTIVVVTASVDWEIQGAHASDFSDAVVVQAAAAVGAGASSSWSSTAPVWSYYRVRIRSTVADTPGTVTLRGLGR